MLSNKLLFYVGGRVLNAVLSLATLIMINRMIEPEEYGRFAYLSMLGGFIGLMAYGWIWSYSFRFGAQRPVDKGLQQASVWLLLSIPIALAACLTVVLLHDFSWLEAVFLSLFPLVVALFNVGQKIQASHSKLKANISFAVLRSLINFVLLVILIFIARGKEALFISSVLGFFVAGIAVQFYEGTFSSRWRWAKPKINDLKFGAGIAASALLTQLNYGLDKLVVNNVLGDKSTGLYTHSYELVFFIIMFVLSIYNISTYPKLQRQYDNNDLTLNEILTKSFRWFASLSIVLLVVMLVTKPVFLMLISENYSEVFSNLFGYNLVISVLTCFIAFHINYAFQLSQQPRFQVVAAGVALVVNLVMSLLLVKRFELEGVAIATITAQLLMISLSMLYVRRFNHG